MHIGKRWDASLKLYVDLSLYNAQLLIILVLFPFKSLDFKPPWWFIKIFICQNKKEIPGIDANYPAGHLKDTFLCLC